MLILALCLVFLVTMTSDSCPSERQSGSVGHDVRTPGRLGGDKFPFGAAAGQSVVCRE